MYGDWFNSGAPSSRLPIIENIEVFLEGGSTPVPAPGTLAIVAFGLLGLAITRRGKPAR